MKKTLLLLTLALASILSINAVGNMRWEEVNDTLTRRSLSLETNAASASQEEGVEIFARDGYIYVVTDHAIPVQVFSILGQLIGEGRLQPGVYRMAMKSRGIYIVKAGMATIRVTL